MKIIAPLLLAACVSTAHAQSVSYEAFTLAETVIDMNWDNSAPVLEMAIKQIETNLKESGATEHAAKTMTSSIRQGFTKDAFSRVTAESISDSMTQDEQKEALAFVKSAGGRKFLTSLNGQNESMNKFLVKLFKASCGYADKELGFFDRGSIKRVCDTVK